MWVARGFNPGIKDYFHSTALAHNYHLERRCFASKMETEIILGYTCGDLYFSAVRETRTVADFLVGYEEVKMVWKSGI